MAHSDARPADPPAPIPLAVVLGLFLGAMPLRPQLLAIGPLLPGIRADLDLSASVAGLITTIPVLCMGIFAPIGPRIAARIGPRLALAMCLVLITGFGLLRASAPGIETVLLATFGVGIGVGMSGAVPSMVVSQHLSRHRAMGTGTYAGGIVSGSAIAAAVAVPLSGADQDWRRALAILSVASLGPLLAWLLLVRPDRPERPLRPQALRLPWGSATAWLLVVVFGLQSVLFYGIVAWLPNALVEDGWSAGDTGVLMGLFNGLGLLTTVGIPLVADRLGPRRGQLMTASIVAAGAIVGVVAMPDLTVPWVVLLGLALGAIFPLVLTLPLDVADHPSQVGAVAALMLLGGYLISAIGPFLLGVARDITGDFGASLWLLAVIAVILAVLCAFLSPWRLHRGVHTG